MSEESCNKTAIELFFFMGFCRKLHKKLLKNDNDFFKESCNASTRSVSFPKKEDIHLGRCFR